MRRANHRRKFLRDAVVFQGKLLVDGFRDLFLMPVAAAAAVVDVIRPGEQPGRRFYDVMHYGKQSDRWIDLFAAADRVAEERPAQVNVPSLDNIVDEAGNQLSAIPRGLRLQALRRYRRNRQRAAARPAM